MRVFIVGRDRELLTRRLFDSITTYLSTSYFADVETVDIPNCSRVRDLQQKLRSELAKLYESNGDFTEADRILQLDASVSSWLRPAKRLPQLSTRLEHTAAKVLEDHSDIRRSLALSSNPRFPLFSLLVQQHKAHGDKLAFRESLCFSPDIIGRSHLHLAAEMEDLDHLHWLFHNCSAQAMKQMESRDIFRLTPLMIAAYTGNVDVFRFLESQGAKMNALDPEGRSVLSLAAMAGHEDIVSHILSQHPSIMKDHFASCSPLHDAVAAGHRDVVELLLQHKAEPRDERPSHGGKKASEVAATHNHKELEAYLSELEDALEHQAMTSPADPLSQQLHSLKEQIHHAVAGTHSPDSGLSRSSTARTSSRRLSKRQRTATPGSHHNSPQSTFSLSGTPAPQPSVTSPGLGLSSQRMLGSLHHFTTFASTHHIVHNDNSTDPTFSEFLDFEGDSANDWNRV